MHTHITDTLTGLTSSLDSLLNTTSQAKLSECSPIPAKEIDTHTDTQAPVSDPSPQKTTASEHVQIKSPVASYTGNQPIPLPDSFHREQVKDDSAHTSDTTDHSDDKIEQSHIDSSPQMSIAHDTNVEAKSSSDTNDQIFTLSDSSHQECSAEDQTIVTSGQTASIGISTVSSTTNDPHQIMLCCNDKLITALSLDPQGIAEVLLAKGLIPENTEAQVRQCSTPRGKATILVTAIRQRIEVAPKRFQEFLDILSKQEWTKDIFEILQSCSGAPHKGDIHLQPRSTTAHSPTKSKPPAKVTPHSEHSPSSEEYTFPTLNPDDALELEAQLITSAESMKKNFAALQWKTIESFKDQRINPRTLINGVFAVTEYEDPSIGKPLLKREKEVLAKAQSIDVIFDILRPHMTFFNYEILEFLIETIGSNEDKWALQDYLHHFRCFCRRSVFEVPKSILFWSQL